MGENLNHSILRECKSLNQVQLNSTSIDWLPTMCYHRVSKLKSKKPTERGVIKALLPIVLGALLYLNLNSQLNSSIITGNFCGKLLPSEYSFPNPGNRITIFLGKSPSYFQSITFVKVDSITSNRGRNVMWAKMTRTWHSPSYSDWFRRGHMIVSDQSELILRLFSRVTKRYPLSGEISESTD